MSERVDRLGRSALHYAVVDGDVEIVQELLDCGANVNLADGNGWTALHFAAQKYSAELVTTLLDAGAEVDAADSFGNTPLWRAVFASEGRGDVIGLLRGAGADVHAKNHAGVSPYSLAKTIASHDVRQFFSDVSGPEPDGA